MARSSSCLRATIRKLSSRFHSHLIAPQSPCSVNNQTLRREHSSGAVQCLTWDRPEELEGSQIRSGSYSSTFLPSKAWAIRSTSPGPMLQMTQNRSYSWGTTSKDRAAPEVDSKEDAGLLNSSDGVSADQIEVAPVVDTQWTDKAYTKLVDAYKAVEEAAEPLYPAINRVLEKYPIIPEIAVPVGVFTGAWLILPRILRTLHSYVEQGSAAVQKGLSPDPIVEVPYELSMWKAMETPSRLFATILTILQVGILVAPNSIAAHYLSQFWAGGGVLCIVWFLHNWKSKVLNRKMSGRSLSTEERDRYLTIDKFSSLGLVIIGALGLAEAYGLAIQSLLTVGGIGGIATAFAAREILGNILTGVSLSFSRPFSVGDQIKVGNLEGKVEEVGLHSTRLLNTDKNPIIVPNSFFQSQVIINKSRAPWRALAVKIPIRLQDFEKVPIFTRDIRGMLNHHPQVSLEEDKPRCFISQFTPSSLEIAISCNLKTMSKDEFILVEQGLLVEAARIITSSGAVLGGQG